MILVETLSQKVKGHAVQLFINYNYRLMIDL